MIQASCSLAAVGGMCSKIKPGLLKLRHASPAVRPCRKPGARQRTEVKSAPLLGEHTAAVLADWFGLDATAVATLRQDGIV
jgi:crotonobetainyl-CoA:carnitine CoA-transferase CaiB-like acyl-CoA transferase